MYLIPVAVNTGVNVCTLYFTSTVEYTMPLVSILDAVFTVSPNKQYRGILIPTTPATVLPECTPTKRKLNKICF